MNKPVQIDIRLDSSTVAVLKQIAEKAGTDLNTVANVALATWFVRNAAAPEAPAADDLTVIQVSKRLRVKPATLATWRMREQGPPYRRVGGRLVYSAAKLEKWLAKNDVTPSVKTNAVKSAAKKKSLKAAVRKPRK